MPAKTYVLRAGGIWRALGNYPDITGGPPPPPPTRVFWFGSSQTNTNLTAAWQKYAIHRTYDSGLPTTWANSVAAGDFAKGQASVWSFSPPIDAFAAGTYDAQFQTVLGGIPSGVMPNGRAYRVYVCGWHEGDAKVSQSIYTVAQWQAASVRAMNMVLATGRTDLITTTITTMQPFYTGQGFTMDDFYLPGVHQFYGLDAYNRWGYDTTAGGNHYNGNPWTEMSERFSQGIAWMVANGVRWGLTETNATEDINTSGGDAGGLHDKSAWLSAGAQHVYDNGAEVFTYWDNNFGSDFDPVLRRLHSSAAFKTQWIAELAKWGSS